MLQNGKNYMYDEIVEIYWRKRSLSVSACGGAPELVKPTAVRSDWNIFCGGVAVEKIQDTIRKGKELWD